MVHENSSSTTKRMEWASGELTEDGSVSNLNKPITHSTPIKYRPLPTASPNLSKIHTPLGDEIIQLTEHLARLRLNFDHDNI